MPFPQEPHNPANSAVDRVRLNVGDFDPLEVELTYELYDYFLTTAAGDENKATFLAADALISKYARAMAESTDEVSANFKERFEGYKELKDTLYRKLGQFEIYAGGLSRSERIGDRLNNDLRDNVVTVGQSHGMFDNHLKFF